jgi:hypothetical protein
MKTLRPIAAWTSNSNPELAVLRPYEAWALSSSWEGQVRNPSDWLLQQWLEVWSVKHGRPYDVFEVPPRMSAKEASAMEKQLTRYGRVVTTLPRKGAWVIGAATPAIEIKQAEEIQSKFEAEMISRGWLGRK